MTGRQTSLVTIKRLREQTEAPVGDCRDALAQAKGDEAKALAILRQKGATVAAHKTVRETRQGLIESYVHQGRIGVLVEVNCETDFVARNDDFQRFCRDIAMQIAAQHPRYVRREDVPAAERTVATAHRSAEEFFKDACLLEQPFIRDQAQTVGDYLHALIGKIRENIVVRRFIRFQLGDA